MLNKIKNQNGIGIAMSLLAIIIISILGTALLIRSISLAGVVTQKNYSIIAIEAARAGVSYAIYKIEANPDYTTNIPITSLASYGSGYTTVTNQREYGYFQVFITNNLAGTTPISSGYTDYKIPGGMVELVSTGYVGNPAMKQIKIVALGQRKDQYFDPFDYALFSEEGYSEQGGGGGNGNNQPLFFTDSYDSDDIGAHSTNPDDYRGGSNGDIGANGGSEPDNFTISLGSRNINGQIKVPPGISVGGSGNFLDPNGIQHTLPAPQYVTTLPEPVDLPSVEEMFAGTNLTAGNQNISSGATLSGGGNYGTLTISGNQPLTLNEGVYVFSSINASGQGNPVGGVSLIVNGNVTIIVTGSINITGQVNINTITTGNGNGRNATTTPYGDASQLKIFGTKDCTEVNVGGAASFCGALYAPEAEITLHGQGNPNADLWGAFVGKKIDINGAKVSVHYDEALGKGDGELVYKGINLGTVKWVYGY